MQIAAASAATIVSPVMQGYPRNHWYVAAFSHEVGRHLLSRQLLDEIVVLYRTEGGEPVALRDQCPHRGLPLSQGKLLGDGIQCGYHGLEFGSDGKCRRVPTQDFIPSRLCVQSFPVVERWQWIWIWMGDPDKADLSKLPDQVSLGVERPGFHPTPFFHAEIAANYQFMHDNLLDSSHFSYLHGGLLDSEDMAKSRFWSEDEGPILRLGREIPESISKGVVAAYFRVTPDHPYHRTMLCETILPAVSVGKQTIYDPADPSYPTRHLFAINALTPASRKSTHLFHVQVTSYEPEWTQQEMEGVRYIVEQDRIAVEAIQKRFEETGVEPTEISVKADHAGLLSRRKIQAMIREEQAGR